MSSLDLDKIESLLVNEIGVFDGEQVSEATIRLMKSPSELSDFILKLVSLKAYMKVCGLPDEAVKCVDETMNHLVIAREYFKRSYKA